MKISIPLFVCLVAAPSLALAQSTAPTGPEPLAPRISADYGKLPLSFESNQGQADSEVRFTSRGNGYSLFLTDKEAVLALSRVTGRKADQAAPAHDGQLPGPGKSLPGFDETIGALKRERLAAGGRSAPLPASGTSNNIDGPQPGLGPGANAAPQTDVVRMQLQGANPGLKVEGDARLPGTVNYFLGNDPAKWHSSIPTYARVKYSGVYPGVDLVYYGNQRQLEYDFVVAPYADPRQVKLHFAGAKKLKLTSEGDLEIIADNGEIAFHKPVIYQQKSGQQESTPATKHELVNGSFVLLAGNTVGFQLGNYDKTRDLVIDPTLAYSTYLGGSGNDVVKAIAVDTKGRTYVTGNTLSSTFPVVNPYQETNSNISNGVAFVAELNSAGSALVYSTYLGGSGSCTYHANEATAGDSGNAIAVDASGDVYIAGQACSNNFPTKSAYQAVNTGTSKGVSNAFVTKLSSDGSSLIYSTYLGGSGNLGGGFAAYSGDYALGIAIDSGGSAYVAGGTWSKDFPTTSGAYQAASPAFPTDAGFIAKLNSTGSELVYSTYLGGSFGNTVYAIAVDASGDTYLTGYAQNSSFPTTPNAFQGYKGGRYVQNAFLTVLNASGSQLLYSTYLGGSGVGPGLGDSGLGIAIDASKNAYVAGFTYSRDFPTSQGAFQTMDTAPTGAYAGFVSKFDTVSGALTYSTYLGGGGSSQVSAIRIDSGDHASVSGTTYVPSSANNFPATSNAYQKVNNAAANQGANAFFAQLNRAGSALIYASYLGGSGIKDSTNGDGANGIVLDCLNNPYFAGFAYSSDFPTTKGSFQSKTKATAGNSTGFISRFAFPTATTTTVTSDNSSPHFGQRVTFTAYVPGKSGCEILPTGSASFSIDGGTPVLVALDSAGHADYSTSSLGVGNHTVVATYPGSTNYSSSSGSLSDTVSPASTSTNLASSPNPSNYGQSVTLTATITASSGPTPTGTVNFLNGSTSLGKVTLNSSGVATLTTTTLPVGKLSITAVYAGSSTEDGSTSPTLAQVVRSPTTSSLTSSLNPSAYGQSVTITATVKASSGPTPTGTVTFTSGTTTLGSGTLNSSGVATLTTSALPVGSNTITAAYSGSSTDLSSSAKLTQKVTEASTTTALTSSPNPSTSGQSVTFTATVSAASGPIPTGTVNFYHGGTMFGSGTLTNGVATYATSTLPVKTLSVTAVYQGSTTDQTSTSPALSQVVNK